MNLFFSGFYISNVKDEINVVCYVLEFVRFVKIRIMCSMCFNYL